MLLGILCLYSRKMNLSRIRRMLRCFRKHKTNIVAYKPLSDPCLLGQVTQHNLHLAADCSSPRAVGLGALSTLVPIPRLLLLAHRNTWAHHCQGLCTLRLAHDHCPRLQKVTRGSLSLMLTLSIPCPLLLRLLTLHLLLWSYLTSHTVSTPPAACFFLWHGASPNEVMCL